MKAVLGSIVDEYTYEDQGSGETPRNLFVLQLGDFDGIRQYAEGDGKLGIYTVTPLILSTVPEAIQGKFQAFLEKGYLFAVDDLWRGIEGAEEVALKRLVKILYKRGYDKHVH